MFDLKIKDDWLSRTLLEIGTIMIPALVQSAFQTGYLSVESEGLIRQVLATRGCKSADVEALQNLYEALQTGEIRREAHQSLQMPAISSFTRI